MNGKLPVRCLLFKVDEPSLGQINTVILKKNRSQVLKADEDYLEYNGEYVYLRNDPSIRVAVSDIAVVI